MAADRERVERILQAIPQRHPFRFIDEILELQDDRITGAYRFRKDEYFYPGHFPGNPITPGVILVEALAQTSVVAFGISLLMAENRSSQGLTTLFTMIEQMEFTGIVRPGEQVIIHGEKIYFRKKNLKVNARMERENGEIVCSGILAGMGVQLDEE